MINDQVHPKTTEKQNKLAHAMTMFEWHERQFKLHRDRRDFQTAKFWVRIVNQYVAEVRAEQGA